MMIALLSPFRLPLRGRLGYVLWHGVLYATLSSAGWGGGVASDASAAAAAAALAEKLPVWPAVRHVDRLPSDDAQTPLQLSRDFSLQLEPSSEERTCATSAALEAALVRYQALIFARPLPRRAKASAGASAAEVKESTTTSASCCLERLVVCATDAEASLENASEAYSLVIEESSGAPSGWRAHLSAATQVGVYRGLETFAQLVERRATLGEYVLVAAPLALRDEPRFRHRGLLLDTVRHWFPMSAVLRTLDAMSAVKLNVLHWHLTDSEALPVESRAYPDMFGAAWSPREVYTVEDVEEVLAYAAARGIRVVPEVDVPGHSRAWALVFPEVFPRSGCPTKWWAMDPSSNSTLRVVKTIIEEFASSFPAGFFHVGGDEIGSSVWGDVRFDCWRHLGKWARENNFESFEDILRYFMLEVLKIVDGSGKRPVVWDEVWRQVEGLPRHAVVQLWEDPALGMDVVSSGYDLIMSPVGAWYLDDLNTSWQKMYVFEPMNGMSGASARARVLGGEAALWAEFVDASTLDAVVWPRAAAVAERLWSTSLEGSQILDHPERIPETTTARLAALRCLLLERGVGASPLEGVGRAGLEGPSSCRGHRTLPLEVAKRAEVRAARERAARRGRRGRRAQRDEL